MKTPCKQCKCRSVGCHANCPDYAAYKQELEAIKKANKEYEETHYMRWW